VIVISRVRCIRSLFIYELSLVGFCIILYGCASMLVICSFRYTYSHQILGFKAHFQQHIQIDYSIEIYLFGLINSGSYSLKLLLGLALVDE
jgi:hypothetical protein